jgi:glycosyltransferase involved in cell wall biosynthesis
MARIAQFIDTLDSGGAERVLMDLSARLPSMGHEVEVMHFGNPWIESQCRQLAIRTTHLPAEQWYRSKWKISGFILRFAGLLRRRRFDILHSHLYGSIAAGSVAATAAGIPHVGTLHDTYLVEEDPARFRILRFSASMGTQLIAVSESMRKYYVNLSGGSVALERIYNGVDIDGFSARRRSNAEGFTFVSVGRLVPIKGFDVLISAMQHISPSVRLRIIGDGPERGMLEKQCHDLGLKGRVEFLGFHEDVPSLLAEADAFVLASRSEGLSCSVVEAMAAGLPCVVTDVGGNGELVIDGETGLLVPAGEVETLGRRMAELACDPCLAANLGASARNRAEHSFSLSATLRSYDELYRNLLPLNDMKRSA